MKLECLNNRRSFILKTLLILILTSINSSQGTPDWCWTKSQVNNPGFIFDQSKGGFNWGFCQSVEESKKQTITYAGFVVTANSANSTTESQVLIKLCGTKGCFPKYIAISNTGFDRTGVRQEIKDFEGIDVGDLEKLKVKLNGTTSWQCKEIFLIKEGIETKFECLKKMEPCSISMDLCHLEALADGSAVYNVSIKTGDEKVDANPGPVHIILYGDKRISQEKIFSDDRMRSGLLATSKILTSEIGAIKGAKLIVHGKGRWKPVLLKIQSESTGEEKIFELKNALLQYPGKNTFEVKDKADDAAASADGPAAPEKGEDGSEGSSFPEINTSPGGKPGGGSGGKAQETLNVNNPDGGLILYEEKKNIINLQCDQKLENTNMILFGPDYPTKRSEYMSVLVRCPYNCHDLTGTVFGVGIHPTNSPICLSGIVDGSLSYYGGIMSVSITSGMDLYKIPKNFPKNIGNIYIKNYESTDSMKSYTLSKVDNVDLVEKDMRILGFDGTLSNYGRIEMRLGGEWGTICNMGNNPRSSLIICKDLGYKSGKWASTDEAPTFCQNAEGKNFCGSSLSKIHFSNIECGTTDNKFDMCNKNYADRQKCDHSKDAIINCFNESYDNEKNIPNKTVRLDAIKENKEVSEIIGRLEMYKIDKFLPVCNLKFNRASANLACKTMGYDSGEIIAGDDANPFKNSITSELGFAASQLECDETSMNLSVCKGLYNDITCTHDMDTVIKCKGENGDPSGRSQYEIKPENNPPELSKLGIPSVNINCATKGFDEEFRGDPGSVYKVCCPADCEKAPGSVWGVGFYSGDSNICLAALHTGILEQKEAGCFVLTRSHGNGNFKSLRINRLESHTSEGNWILTFTLAKLNSGWENMNSKWQTDDMVQSSFLEEEFNLENKNKKSIGFLESIESNLISGFKPFPGESVPLRRSKTPYSSFMETSIMLPNPIFSFVESNTNHIFSRNDNYVFEGGKLTKVNDFTIFTKFNMYEYSGPAVLFSFRGADGFNIWVNESDELMLGSMTDTKYQHYLGMIVPLKTKCSLFIVNKSGFLSFSILIKNGPMNARSRIAAAFDIPIEGRVGIGRLASTNAKQFTGKIDFIEVYPMAMGVEVIPDLLAAIKNRKNNNKLVKQYTVDARECISPCMSSPPETGNPPPEAVLNAAVSAEIDSSSGLIKFGEEQKDENPIQEPTTSTQEVNRANNSEDAPSPPAPGGIISPDNHKDPPYPQTTKLNSPTLAGTNNIEPLAADEDTTLEDHRFKGLLIPKTFFRLTCPKMDAQTYYPIYGFAIYRANSSICRAALHFGKLKPNEKKDVIIRIEGVQQAYNGGVGHYNIQSEDILETDKKLSFTIEDAKNLRSVDCETDLRSAQFLNASLSEVFVVQCPKDCANTSSQVFGGNTTDEKCAQFQDNSASNCIYSDDSSICKSAIHCGVLNNMGGFVEIKVDGEQPKFQGTSSFGIQSKEKPSQVRSFSFVGERSAIYANFVESFQGSILENWAIESSYFAINKDKNSWSFYENNHNFFNLDGKKEDIRAVKHTGITSTALPFTSATIIKKRNLEFANGLVKFNLMLYELEPVFVYLRYVDKETHIGLLINNKNNINNLTLFVKLQGSIKVIDAKNYPMELKKWYRFKVFLYSDAVKISMQEDKVRGHKELFNAQISTISRGTIAFGTNGNNLYYLTGISIEPFALTGEDRADESKRLSWTYIIKKAQEKSKVKVWCKKTFKFSMDEYSRCLLPHFYCRYRCQELLPENNYGILYYSCVNECVVAMKSTGFPDESSKSPLEKSYAENEMVDFLPKGQASYIPAVVMKVTNKAGDKFASIEYEDEMGNKHTEDLIFKDERLDKCGTKLKKRSDCALNKK